MCEKIEKFKFRELTLYKVKYHYCHSASLDIETKLEPPTVTYRIIHVFAPDIVGACEMVKQRAFEHLNTIGSKEMQADPPEVKIDAVTFVEALRDIIFAGV